MIDVMLSSTVEDMLDDRTSALTALGSIPFVQVVGAKPISQAPFALSPYAATVEMARTCHLYLLFLGRRYGYEPEEGKSATELEFDAAYAADPTKVLVFKKRVERTEKKQRQFISRVGDYYSGYWITTYQSADELARMTLTAFEFWIKERAAIGYRLDYFDHFLRMSVQRSPVPGAQLAYSVKPDDIELTYTFFGAVHSIHFAKSAIVNDFWGCLAKLDQAFREWRG